MRRACPCGAGWAMCRRLRIGPLSCPHRRMSHAPRVRHVPVAKHHIAERHNRQGQRSCAPTSRVLSRQPTSQPTSQHTAQAAKNKACSTPHPCGDSPLDQHPRGIRHSRCHAPLLLHSAQAHPTQHTATTPRAQERAHILRRNRGSSYLAAQPRHLTRTRTRTRARRMAARLSSWAAPRISHSLRRVGGDPLRARPRPRGP